MGGEKKPFHILNAMLSWNCAHSKGLTPFVTPTQVLRTWVERSQICCQKSSKDGLYSSFDRIPPCMKTPYDLGLHCLYFFFTFWSTKLPSEFSFKFPLQNLRAFLAQHFKFFYIHLQNKFKRPKNHMFRVITVMTPLLVPIYTLLVFLVYTTKIKEGRVCFGLKLRGSPPL